jgi:ribosomal protein L40E
MTKNKRGQKLCSKCNTANGVRAYECKSCGTEFKMKKIRRGSKKIQVEDFRTLNKGDRIKVLSRSGNYYYKQNGDKHYWTTPGEYIVSSISLDNQGINCYGTTNRNSGYHYLYMGKEQQQQNSTICWNAPHKIVLLKVAEPVAESNHVVPKLRRSRS